MRERKIEGLIICIRKAKPKRRKGKQFRANLPSPSFSELVPVHFPKARDDGWGRRDGKEGQERGV